MNHEINYTISEGRSAREYAKNYLLEQMVVSLLSGLPQVEFIDVILLCWMNGTNPASV